MIEERVPLIYLLFSSFEFWRIRYTDTNEYIAQTVYNYYGRDARDIAFGSKVINGKREFWFASNNKSNTTMYLGNTMTYEQSFWVSRSLSTSNSRRSYILDDLTGGASNGTVTGL